MTDIPPPPPSSQAVLDALQRSGPALALADAHGSLLWCSAAFAALGEGAVVALAKTSVTAIDIDIDAPGPDGAPAPWRLRVTAAGASGRWISAEPLAELHAARADAARLHERLEMVQALTDTGVFERDAVTLQGTWDHHMYRIWGLPERPAPALAPSFAETSDMIFSGDRRQGAFRATLSQPGLHTQRTRIHRPDGQVRHLHTKWQVSHDAQGAARRVLGINTDDTEACERTHRAEQLRSELDVALKLGQIGLWRHDLATDRLFLDERGSEVVGLPYSSDGVANEQARARIHPEDLASARDSAALTLRTGEPSDMKLRYPRPAGGWRHVVLRRALQRGPEGEPLGFIGVLQDETERVEERQRALEYARRLEAAADAARVGLWSIQLDTALPSWNHRMYELFGLDPAAGPLALDDWLLRCMHEGDRARVRAAIGAWWRRGQGEGEIEFRVVRPADGALRWLMARGTIEGIGSKPTLRAEGMVVDITEQQRTLRQLRDTVERMGLTTQALGLGTWTMDRHQEQAHCDEQMFKLRGVASPARMVSRAEAMSYLHPDDRARGLAGQIGRIADGQPWQVMFRVQWPDGQVRWITSHSVPVFDDQGRLDGRIGVNWDCTEAQTSAQAVREREVAVAESQAKSQAMSRISHELRTPLNAVLGFTQLLRGAGADNDAARRARWLAHVEDAGRHLLALIDDVLELSRAEVGELKLESLAVTCAAAVDAALPLLAGAAQERGVTLRRETIEGVVLADPVRLRQVLINLLSNAIKYNRPGGEVRLWSRAQGATVTLHVADTGLGIAPERLRHAFEPFNRLGAEATGVEGSGLGLALVKVLVETMGGQVEVRSQLGQGSEFIVHLPAASAEAAAAALAATPGSDAGAGPSVGSSAGAPAVPASARVLYVEDNPVNALLVREMLAHRPALTLEVAEDGLSGVRRARETLPDLVLVDMQLPDIDGHAVLRALRADPRTAGIRCVALSANATPDDVAAALAAGFADYWTKPIDFRRFMEGLDAMLGRRGC